MVIVFIIIITILLHYSPFEGSYVNSFIGGGRWEAVTDVAVTSVCLRRRIFWGVGGGGGGGGETLLTCPVGITRLKKSAITFVSVFFLRSASSIFWRTKPLLIRMMFTYLNGFSMMVTFLYRRLLFTYRNRRFPGRERGAEQTVGRNEVHLT